MNFYQSCRFTDEGVTIIAIGVGPRVNRARLVEMASGNNTVLFSPSIDNLDSIRQNVVDLICNSKFEYESKCTIKESTKKCNQHIFI